MTRAASAQNLPRHYQPPRPTISPYANLMGSNQGVLPNYYSLVRPQLQQQATNQQQQSLIRQNVSSIQELSRRAPDVAPAMPQSGVHTEFMNHHAYFFQHLSAGTAAAAHHNSLPARTAHR